MGWFGKILRSVLGFGFWILERVFKKVKFEKRFDGSHILKVLYAGPTKKNIWQSF
jgi:hypothetical protein